VLSLAAAALLSAGLWFFSDRFMAPQRVALQKALEGVGDYATLGVERLVSASGAAIAWAAGSAAGSATVVASSLPAAPTVPEPPRRQKTVEELRIEIFIDAAFQEYFRDFTIGARRMTVRMPFALNNERGSGRAHSQAFYLSGKGTPDTLWPYIDSVFASKAFGRYAAQIAAPGEKAVVFMLPRRTYHISSNQNLLEALRQDSYPGTPTRIFVRRDGDQISEADVYNYLYAVASVGVDCSGFAYHVLESIARAHGIDADRELARRWKVGPREVRQRVGLWFYDPANGYTEMVADRIEDLRPADLILFRGSDGSLKHSAVIQSIDLENGIIRYLQSTDWAIEEERGVHLSIIRFDPSRPRVGLSHYSVRWLQQVRPPFDGEEEPRDWQTDGDRYLWYTDAGGSMVVRPRFLASAFMKAEPLFYTALFPEEDRRPKDSSTAYGMAAPPWLSRSP
jgi:hypothetical protein